MPNKNIIIEDARTGWNSTYDMIKAAWEKREVLKAMTSDHLNTNKIKILIKDEEWELFAFCEATRYFLSQNQLHCQMYRDFMDF